MVHGSYSKWRETNLGVPQSSVLGHLLFSIYITDLFHLMNTIEICNYADYATCGVSGQAVQPKPLASLKLSMAVYCQKLDGRPSG